jgi:hypothetical protein
MTGAGYAILAVAFIIRAASAYLYPLSNRLFSDMGNYSNIAEDLLAGTWLPTHFFQPIGFPFVVAVFKLAFRNWTQALAIYQSIITSNRRYDLFLVWGAPILGLFICVYVFKSEIRFRVPFDVYFIPLAVRGWMSIIASSSPALPGESRLTPSIN